MADVSTSASTMVGRTVIHADAPTGSNLPRLTQSFAKVSVFVSFDFTTITAFSIAEDEGYEKRKRCSDTQFECKRNHRCIDMKYVCDSDNDCKDFSDEDTSEGGPCRKFFLKLPRANMNDTVSENHTCTAEQFHCQSNRCIPRTWVCVCPLLPFISYVCDFIAGLRWG